MIKVIVTDSAFNLLNILCDNLNANGLQEKNLVFTEEKISLMAEMNICRKFGGSLNTDVYSFGNYLRTKMQTDRVLSKEGSAMAVRKVLSALPLKRFSRSKSNLAPSMCELIMQLKSAKVSKEDIAYSFEKTGGILKDKLEDIFSVYSGYEKFLIDNGYEDQSSILSHLPDIIKEEDGIKDCNVFIVGFSGFTAQMREIIKELIKKAKSFTAILIEDENTFAFVNETSKAVADICCELNLKFDKCKVPSEYSEYGKIIKDNLFSPTAFNREKLNADCIKVASFSDMYAEITAVAEIIKKKVMLGARYRDFMIALDNFEVYSDAIKSIFALLDIPFFLDSKKEVSTHPLISLILSYIEVFRKNFERDTLNGFYKNPLVCEDKDFGDRFENYLIKYNINYGRIKLPFTHKDEDEDLQEFEDFRIKVVSLFDNFDVFNLLNKLNVKERLENFSLKLNDMGLIEEKAVNDQMYDAVMNILSEMKSIGGEYNYTEFKSVFLSGISALELSIIPQYNDAVFIGDYKSIGLARSKCLFAVGLTGEVPSLKEDVALLSDSDINSLSDIKVLVEPKIKIINHRTRESIALALSNFEEELYLSYPVIGKGSRSEILSYVDRLFKCGSFEKTDGYMTLKEGYESFAKEASRFAQGIDLDFTLPSSFYKVSDKDRADCILKCANKEIKLRLDCNRQLVAGNMTSPTTIEDYFKCPYYSFMSHGLKLKERREGEVDSLSVGNFAHEILMAYARRIEEVVDEKTSDELFDKIINNVLSKKEYSHFTEEPKTSFQINMLSDECRKFCYKMYQSLIKGEFKPQPSDIEVKFGEKGKYPAISLLGGKVNLSGKIDRVDRYKDYYRVIDYKTGGTDDTLKSLFTGEKLQLFLYALAVPDGKLAGAYYLPISDAFSSKNSKEKSMAIGFCLAKEDTIVAQDGEIVKNKSSEFLPITVEEDGSIKNGFSEEGLNAMVNYALKICESAVKNMDDGVIVPSPNEKACKYCKYKSMCEQENPSTRKVKSVNEDVIKKSVLGE